MQAREVIVTATLALSLLGSSATAEGPQNKAVDPKVVEVDEYVPSQYLDPNLLAIQVRRAEDRILALEQTNERLVKGYNDLASKYNALRDYLDADKK